MLPSVKECELNALDSYDVVESLPPDYAHDILEGSARLVIGAVLTKPVKTRKISLEAVNEALLQFPYSRGEENRPGSLKWLRVEWFARQPRRSAGHFSGSFL